MSTPETLLIFRSLVADSFVELFLLAFKNKHLFSTPTRGSFVAKREGTPYRMEYDETAQKQHCEVAKLVCNAARV